MSVNIMVTGATGNYGSLAVDFIKKFNPNVNLFGIVHSPQKVDILKAKGIEARVADFKDKDSLIKAFKGIDRLLFVSVSIPGIQKNVIEAAKECNIKYIAYTSIAGIETPKFGLEINHGETENWIRESGIPHTFLRNSWYVNLDEGLFKAAKNTGKFYYTTEGVVSYALRREYAEAGARAILNENNPEVLLLARKGLTYPEYATAIEEALGRKLEVRKVSMEEFNKYLSEANVTPLGKNLSINMQNYVKGGNNSEELNNPIDFEKILGRPLEPISDILKEYLLE